jgi:hypothetical protein
MLSARGEAPTMATLRGFKSLSSSYGGRDIGRSRALAERTRRTRGQPPPVHLAWDHRSSVAASASFSANQAGQDWTHFSKRAVIASKLSAHQSNWMLCWTATFAW